MAEEHCSWHGIQEAEEELDLLKLPLLNSVQLFYVWLTKPRKNPDPNLELDS